MNKDIFLIDLALKALEVKADKINYNIDNDIMFNSVVEIIGVIEDENRDITQFEYNYIKNTIFIIWEKIRD